MKHAPCRVIEHQHNSRRDSYSFLSFSIFWFHPHFLFFPSFPVVLHSVFLLVPESFLSILLLQAAFYSIFLRHCLRSFFIFIITFYYFQFLFFHSSCSTPLFYLSYTFLLFFYYPFIFLPVFYYPFILLLLLYYPFICLPLFYCLFPCLPLFYYPFICLSPFYYPFIFLLSSTIHSSFF